MPAHSLEGLMKWLRRDEWRDAFDETFEQHLMAACNQAGVEKDELAKFLDDHELSNLWGCVFEDFLTQLDDAGRNIVDDYIKRRGWKESASDRRYMIGLRNSVMSLYEVSSIEPGASFLARDLIRGGDPVTVSEHSATKTLKQWDRIAARLIDMGGKTILGGGVLLIDLAASEELLKGTKAVSRELPLARKRLAEAPSTHGPMQSAAPLFSTTWLTYILKNKLAPITPNVVNSDGEDLVFVSVNFPLAGNVKAAAIRAALDKVPELRPESASFWNWVRVGTAKPEEPRKARGERQLALITTMDEGVVVLGTVAIKGRFVTLEANSVARGRRGQQLLVAALANLVGKPVVKEQSIDEARRSPRAKPGPKSLELPPEQTRQLVHAAMELHYRQQLEEPIPALGDISPRQAARTETGRKKVVSWLKTLENYTGRVSKDDPMTTYDFSWMWTELGVEHQRK